MGFFEDSEQQQLRSDVEILPMVRLATIDSFQGEEAKVIILSTVRSNLQDRVGFLQTTNRINVACSRARNGFYIVGNSTLLRTVGMWESIIASFQAKGRIGPSFLTHCSRHPDFVQSVSQPQQFRELKTCDIACNHIFDCGHKCPEKCHEPALHSRMRCGTVIDELLPCDHTCHVKCADLDRGAKRECTVKLDPVVLSCGHSVEQTCSSEKEPVLCNAQCEFIFHNCGHRCSGGCFECRTTQIHSKCEGLCAKPLACGHTCLAKCHSGPCPRCERMCLRSCGHGKSKPCHVACNPCVQGCSKTVCAHGSCSSICSLPCNQLPCSEPCTLLLPCSHLCPGLCGEACATVCLQCETGEVPSDIKMFLRCGHNFNVADLDSKFEIERVFEVGKFGEILDLKHSMAQTRTKPVQCPQCGVPCDDVRRYRHFRQLKAAPETIDHLYKMFSHKMAVLAGKVQSTKKELDNGFKWFCEQVEPGPLGSQVNAALVKARILRVMPAQSMITRFQGMYLK